MHFSPIRFFPILWIRPTPYPGSHEGSKKKTVARKYLKMPRFWVQKIQNGPFGYFRIFGYFRHFCNLGNFGFFGNFCNLRIFMHFSPIRFFPILWIRPTPYPGSHEGSKKKTVAIKYLKMPRFWVQKIKNSAKQPICFKIILNLSQKSRNNPKIVLKWSQNGVKWSQNGPKMIPKCPKMVPKWIFGYFRHFCNLGNFGFFGNFCNLRIFMHFSPIRFFPILWIRPTPYPGSHEGSKKKTVAIKYLKMPRFWVQKIKNSAKRPLDQTWSGCKLILNCFKFCEMPKIVPKWSQHAPNSSLAETTASETNVRNDRPRKRTSKTTALGNERPKRPPSETNVRNDRTDRPRKRTSETIASETNVRNNRVRKRRSPLETNVGNHRPRKRQ